ncbi:LytR C-terminal domain-containing protein [Streptomyces sp. TR02-1]|uniref:LytR C-terminal domain-containing protein n=1 Tax=Streptomyces sp. TR02-1 TaxID=3385977 RepID=UPI0039A23D07
MSMLTPPGMGGQYRIKGDRYPRMRKPKNRRKLVLAGVATAMVLGLVAWGSLQLFGVFSTDGPASAQAADGRDGQCRVQEGKAPTDARAAGPGGTPGAKRAGAGASPTALPDAGKITVNVLNATPRSGLAAKTAKELKKRGFRIGEIANAPARLDHKVDGPGLLIGGTGAETVAAMKVLGTQLDGTESRHDERDDAAIDLVIGNDFASLAKAKDAERAVQALASPSPKPSPGC